MAVGLGERAGQWRTFTGSQVTGVILALTLLAGGASAQEAPTTLSEADLPGGEFSAEYRSPTRVPPGVDRISGTGGVGSDDYLVFDLPAGAQTIRLEFRAPEAIGYSYSAGGVVLFDTAAFAYEWAGTQLLEPVRLDHRRRWQSMTITLPESFGGRLYLALNFTHGEDIAYAVSVPANVPVLTPALISAPVGAQHRGRAGQA
jgi:hypothetical protein